MEFYNHIYCKYKGIKGFVSCYNDAVRYQYMITKTAIYRFKILTFWERHGLQATIDAFGHKRSTLYAWKQRLQESKGRIDSLNNGSRAPKNRRKRVVHPKIKEFIVSQRKEHPKLGKDKIKSLLDEFCLKQGIKTVSESTIGRIINDLKKRGLIRDYSKKVSYYARTDNFVERKQQKKRKKIRRKGYKPEKQGDLLQIDTIVKFINGIKRYIVTAIDIKSDFAFAYAHKTASSKSTKDFLEKLEQVAPFKITHIQTDNGSEFEKYFRDYIKKQGITHFHNYPRRPRMNAHIERFNRTLQEEFANYRGNTLAYNLDRFNYELIEWLLWYNTKRPHWSLGLKPPMKFILDNLIANNLLVVGKSNMWWTDTSA